MVSGMRASRTHSRPIACFVADWLTKQNMTADEGYAYFVKRVAAIAMKQGRRPIQWSEVRNGTRLLRTRMCASARSCPVLSSTHAPLRTVQAP